MRCSPRPPELTSCEPSATPKAVLAAWESGKREVPKGNNLLKLAEALGFEAGELMAMTHESRKESSKEVHLLAAFRSLPKECQLIAIKLVEALK